MPTLLDLGHEYDSSLACNYCGAAAESVGGALCVPCPVRVAQLKEGTRQSSGRNPVLVQDRAEDLLDNWRKYRYLMFPQQLAIYRNIAQELAKREEQPWVLEAGCGSGQGSHILACHHGPRGVIATDVCNRNVDFARCLYWADELLQFGTWDIQQPWTGPNYPVVVAVEVIEHVADPVAALRNLLSAATEEAWISTPNGINSKRPPENQQHVCEYTPKEMTMMIHDAALTVAQNVEVKVLSWKHFEQQTLDTTISPLVYRVRK
jgi:2-polyprenyl-3-methyl-5-hydroxy-6-metoxy-1,4-benzoquinol methylase